MYTTGAIKNILLQESIYPGWTCRFYVEKNHAILEELKKYNCEIVIKDSGTCLGLFWRFEPAFDETVDLFIVRDCDSRINQREADAVKEWEESEYNIHSMKDHFYHRNYHLLGGMWGAKNPALLGYKKLMEDFILKTKKNRTFLKREIFFDTDQYFLNAILWPFISNQCLTHDDLGHQMNQNKSFKIKLPPGLFVGQQLYADDKPLPLN